MLARAAAESGPCLKETSRKTLSLLLILLIAGRGSLLHDG